MNIVVDDKIPFIKGVFEPFATVDYLPGNQINNAALKKADALIIRSITICDEILLKGTPVKIIATATIGDDHIDKVYCKNNNILWASAKGCNAAAVEQYFTTGLLELASQYQIDLSQKTIGIIGVGNIGKRIEKVSRLLGMKVMLNDPPRESTEGSAGFSTLEEIAASADMITLHTPLHYGGRDKTFHLIDQSFFDQLKKSIVLINTARGAVVDSASLIRARADGKVAYAMIDVWEGEPDVNSELVKVTHIATPHIAGYSLEGKANGTALVVNAVSKYFNLGLNDWKPEIPSAMTVLVIDCISLAEQEVLQRIYEQVYPIYNDDRRFRTNPDKFEELRRDYTYRRENNSFYLSLTGISESLRDILREFGFQFQDIQTIA